MIMRLLQKRPGGHLCKLIASLASRLRALAKDKRSVVPFYLVRQS